MVHSRLGADGRRMVQEILGYLNFSSGAADPRFLQSINRLFEQLQEDRPQTEPIWRALGVVLRAMLKDLHGQSPAFQEVEQAEHVLDLVFDHALPAYRRFHRDLLFHQTDEDLFQPMFIGRMCEAVLRQGGPWDQADRIVGGALTRLNDYIGHRPVAVLRTEQKIQPYAHEWVRPIPLFIRGAGVAAGRYHDLVQKALEILKATNPALLRAAMFDPELLDELAMDPRAYDFDHPVNKRPNYLFGQWDPHHIDNSGRYRRYVLQQVALDAMLLRIEERGSLPYEEVLREEASVLAGTILMGSGVSGDRPGAHDSAVTLATLVQHIAVYRDTFYEDLLVHMEGPHAERLRAESTALRQPLGAARQHFNQLLARRRADQVQRVNLAELYARMGYTEAAAREVRLVPVASARLRCDIRCRLKTAYREIGEGRLEAAAALLPEIEDLLHRAIECGAMVDPWNILGFGAQFSLFPSPENSVHDHRVDELIELVGDIFNLHVQIEKEAAAAGAVALQRAISERLDVFARWWDKYATTEVSSIEGISGRETRESADHVAEALRAWHEAGTAAGDLAFWRQRAGQFHSAKAYALVIEALLEQRDPVAAMALLVQWLSQAGEISLAEEAYDFHNLSLAWMEDLWEDAREPASRNVLPQQRWPLARKFLDYIEANAEEYWQVPRFELAAESPVDAGKTEEADDGQGLFEAAYEDVTYRDSTDDGFEGEMLEGGGGSPTDFELVLEAERIVARLSFLSTLAQLWKAAATASAGEAAGHADRDDALAGWLRQATGNHGRLMELLATVHRYRIPPPRGTHESLVEFDRRRAVKETLLEQIIATCVEMGDAARIIRAVMHQPEPAREGAAWEEPADQVLRAVFRGDAPTVRRLFPALTAALGQQPLLYVALARGGNPQRIVASRSIQGVLRRLLAYLPRLGLLVETYRLLETVQEMEIGHPVGPGAITEFDQVFDIGCRAIVRGLAMSAGSWRNVAGGRDGALIGLLEQATEALLRCWLVHSRGVRLSVLETVSGTNRWQGLKRFVQQYGSDLFTQRFMGLGNLRGILHQGVDAWLQSLLDEPEPEESYRMLEDLGRSLGREDAVRSLTIAIEAVVENYPEYVDYNSTTTQSDRGEMLYTLLDFLRLRAGYDRVAWNLRPVMVAHEVLVRCGLHEAAEIWREAVAQRTRTIADDHLKRFARLTRQYGMRLRSISDRLGERFVRPLLIDRLRALIEPAIEQQRSPPAADSPSVFTQLQAGIAEFTKEPSGAGFDVPAWLDALQEELDRLQTQDTADLDANSLDPHLTIPQTRLSIREARRQVKLMLGG